ncbi:MAG: prolyl oligopeptidase family serine peptidase [Thermoleophilaceae bacterium]
MRLAPVIAVLAMSGLCLPAAAVAHPLRLLAAPAFVETLGPDRHRAVVITMHGGAWIASGPGAAAHERPHARAWAARGWTVLNISYRPGRHALGDVLWVYDRVRRHVGRHTPVCLAGSSAGGHLALMVAVRRRSVDCVVARGAPTDLVAIHRHAAWGASGPQRLGPAQTRAWAIQAFGRRRLRAMSPARQAHRIRARVLLLNGHRDPFVPWAQQERLARALPRAQVLRLSWGDVAWVHTSVSDAALQRAERAARAIADAAYSSS